MNDAAREQAHPAFKWYATVTIAWFSAWGIGTVAVSWLVVGVLGEGGRGLSFTMATLQVPALLLLLVGGIVADRLDPRRLLMIIPLLALPVVILLLRSTWSASAGLALLTAYCLSLGTASAFAAPARDSLLSPLAGSDLMRAVTALTMCQFGGQALGSLSATAAEGIGVPGVLAVQIALLALSAYAATRLPPGLHGTAVREPALRAIRAGLATVARHPALRIPVGLTTAIGVFFMGPFLVGFPLVVHDLYDGGPFEFGLVQALFPLGTILGSLAIRARGGIVRKGLAMLLAMTNGTVMLALLASGIPFWAFLTCSLVWGTGGAIFINSGRALVQEHAPPDQRGRVLSAYQLGFLGSATLGSLLTGALCEALGPLIALRLSAACMALVVASVALFSSARRLGAPTS